jgi:capsular exopolysaccharide synthesis family protein
MTANLITVSEPRSAVAEAYRRLRTNLEFASLDHPIQTVLVVSADEAESGATTVANLAVSIAQSGRSVILVDSDLRHPTLHDVFGLDNGLGLVAALENPGADLPLLDSGVAGLLVLPSGPVPEIPVDVVASPSMIALISALKSKADIVLFSAPPVVEVTDAAVLASRVDGVLLIVNAGKTRRATAQRAKALLDKVNARILGAVLGNAPIAEGQKA